MNCYVLIGGRSERMGRSKVDLPFAGSTFLERIAAAARPVFDALYAVQRPGGAPAAIVETIFEPPHELEAPAFGVLRAIDHAADDCFILAIDYPLVTSEVLRYIEARFRAATAPLVVPRWNGKLQMLCAAYAKSIGPILESRIAGGRFDLRGLADDAAILEEAELRARFSGEPLMNVNTPEELEAARRI